MVPDSSVCITTRYGLDGPGSESRWRRDFLRRPWVNPASWLPSLFRLYSGWGVVLTNHSRLSAEVRERVELYLYPTSGPSWSVIGWTLPLPFSYTSYYYFSTFGLRTNSWRRVWPFALTRMASHSMDNYVRELPTARTELSQEGKVRVAPPGQERVSVASQGHCFIYHTETRPSLPNRKASECAVQRGTSRAHTHRHTHTHITQFGGFQRFRLSRMS